MVLPPTTPATTTKEKKRLSPSGANRAKAAGRMGPRFRPGDGPEERSASVTKIKQEEKTMKTKKTITLMLALLMVLAALPWQGADAFPGQPAYNLDDIAVINGIIDAHPELGWPKAPADGSSVPDAWTGKVSWMQMASRYVRKIDLSGTGISGALKVNGLPVLQILYCNDNQLTGLDVSGLPYLVQLHCHDNFMADRSAVTGREINWDCTNFIFDPQTAQLHG